LFATVQKGWSRLLTHAIVEVAKALGGSFKLVTLTPKTVREMTQLLREPIKGWEHTNKSKKHKGIHKIQTLAKYTKKTHSAQPGCMNWSW